MLGFNKRIRGTQFRGMCEGVRWDENLCRQWGLGKVRQTVFGMRKDSKI